MKAEGYCRARYPRRQSGIGRVEGRNRFGAREGERDLALTVALGAARFKMCLPLQAITEGGMCTY